MNLRRIGQLKSTLQLEPQDFSSNLFPLIVVVVEVLRFAFDFAAMRRMIHELEANFDLIDNRRDWVANTLINLIACNSLLGSQIAFLNHLYLIPSSIRFFALFSLLSVAKSRRIWNHCMA